MAAIASHDGRAPRFHQRRWLVERIFLWLQWKRRPVGCVGRLLRDDRVGQREYHLLLASIGVGQRVAQEMLLAALPLH